MTQLKGQGSWLDVAGFAERVMSFLEPMIEEYFDRLVQGTLDRQSIAWTNMQVQKHLEHRERREPREKHRFISDQPVTDPTIPPGGAANEVLIKLNALVGAVELVAKQQREPDQRSEEQFEELKIQLERIANQVAYLLGGNPWEQPPKESWIEKPQDS